MSENILAIIRIAGSIIYKHLLKPSLLYNKILKNELDGTATVIALKESGTYINNKPELIIDVSIVGANGQIFYTSIRQVISIVELYKFQIKTQHKVKYDATSEEAIFT